MNKITTAPAAESIELPKTRQPTRTSADNATIGAKQISALRALLADIPKREWSPLRSWPAMPHPKQERIDEFRRAAGKGTN